MRKLLEKCFVRVGTLGLKAVGIVHYQPIKVTMLGPITVPPIIHLTLYDPSGKRIKDGVVVWE